MMMTTLTQNIGPVNGIIHWQICDNGSDSKTQGETKFYTNTKITGLYMETASLFQLTATVCHFLTVFRRAQERSSGLRLAR
jgi:hypothetical protein